MPVNGSVPVSPTQTTTYTVAVTNSGGTASASVKVAVAQMLLQITSPLDGDLITHPKTLVHGTIANSTGIETGVVVNGVPAIISGNEFVANGVNLEEGSNIITAVATDTQGNTSSHSIQVTLDTYDKYLQLTANTYSSVPPFETTLIMNGTFSFADASLSYSGPGEVEFLPGANGQEQAVRMTTEGVYRFTAEAVDAQNNVYSDTVAIVVVNRNELDQLFKGKWNGMKAKLAAGATEEALGYFLDGSRERYRTAFTDLADILPQIVAEMQDIQMIHCNDASVRA